MRNDALERRCRVRQSMSSADATRIRERAHPSAGSPRPRDEQPNQPLHAPEDGMSISRSSTQSISLSKVNAGQHHLSSGDRTVFIYTHLLPLRNHSTNTNATNPKDR